MNKHIGSSFDDFLEEEDIREEVESEAIDRVNDWSGASVATAIRGRTQEQDSVDGKPD